MEGMLKGKILPPCMFDKGSHEKQHHPYKLAVLRTQLTLAQEYLAKAIESNDKKTITAYQMHIAFLEERIAKTEKTR